MEGGTIATVDPTAGVSVGAVTVTFTAQSSFRYKAASSMVPTEVTIQLSEDGGASFVDVAAGRYVHTPCAHRRNSLPNPHHRATCSEFVHQVFTLRRNYRATHVRLVMSGPARWFGLQHVSVATLLPPSAATIAQSDIAAYVGAATPMEVDALRSRLSALSPRVMQLLNAARQCLVSFLPHCLAKVDRVSFGLLQPADEAALGRPQARNRKLMAIPFVGKVRTPWSHLLLMIQACAHQPLPPTQDTPSEASEFAHPDVQICATALAYRFEGLRASDVASLIQMLQHQLKSQAGPINKRPAYDPLHGMRWLVHRVTAVMLLRRYTRFNQLLRAARTTHGDDAVPKDSGDGIVPLQVCICAGCCLHAHGGCGVITHANALPQLLELQDPAQLARLYQLFHYEPLAALEYLRRCVFPSCLQHRSVKLSASGEEIGGSIVFGTRLGFSGTPSSLLPTDMGDCQCVKQ